MKWIFINGLAIYSTTCIAQVVEPLNFGSLVVPNNARQSSITIYPDNKIETSGLYVYEAGSPALIVFDSLPVGTRVYISDDASETHLTSSAHSQYFVVENLHYQKSHIVNQYGELTLSIGATLRTSANGSPYFDGKYSSVLEISLDY